MEHRGHQDKNADWRVDPRVDVATGLGDNVFMRIVCIAETYQGRCMATRWVNRHPRPKPEPENPDTWRIWSDR